MSVSAAFQMQAPKAEGATSNQPVAVKIELPHHGLGGVRQVVELTLWEAIELRRELNRILDGGEPVVIVR